MTITVTGQHKLTRIATMQAVATALTTAMGKPTGWEFKASLEGRQDETPKRGYIIIGATTFAENDPLQDGVIQTNLRTTTTLLTTEYEMGLQAARASDLEEGIDFLWEAVPLAGPEVHEHLVLRITDTDSTMRATEQNALRTTIVRISATQLATTGGSIL